MADYRGFVTGPSGETLATTTVTPAQMAEANVAETARIQKAVAARLEQEAAAAAERERSAAELGARELAEYRERASAAWLGSGGSAAEFTTAWPGLRTRYLTEKTVEGLGAFERTVERTKQQMRESGRFPKF